MSTGSISNVSVSSPSKWLWNSSSECENLDTPIISTDATWGMFLLWIMLLRKMQSSRGPKRSFFGLLTNRIHSSALGPSCKSWWATSLSSKTNSKIVKNLWTPNSTCWTTIGTKHSTGSLLKPIRLRTKNHKIVQLWSTKFQKRLESIVLEDFLSRIKSYHQFRLTRKGNRRSPILLMWRKLAYKYSKSRVCWSRNSAASTLKECSHLIPKSTELWRTRYFNKWDSLRRCRTQNHASSKVWWRSGGSIHFLIQILTPAKKWKLKQKRLKPRDNLIPCISLP